MDVFWYRKGQLQKVHHTHIKNNLHTIFREHDKMWIDMGHLSAEDEEMLRVFFNIHPLTIEDCAKGHGRPKIEEFPNYIYVVLYGLNEQGEFVQRNFIIGEDYLITVQHDKPKGYEDLKTDTTRLAELLTHDTEFVMHHLIDMEVDKYYPVLEKFDVVIERLETKALQDTGNAFTKEIFTLKHQLLAFRHHLGPQREVLYQLSHAPTKFFMASSKDYFRDVYDHVVHALDSIDNYREMLNGALEVHLSVTSNRMNEVMKVLTVISTIFLPLTLIASIYGMNFDRMPELHWYSGYFLVLSMMAVLAVSMYWFFKRKEWV
jgi:magnesium transporter